MIKGSVLFYDLKVGDKYTVGSSPTVFTKTNPQSCTWMAGDKVCRGRISRNQPVDRVLSDGDFVIRGSDFASAYTDWAYGTAALDAITTPVDGFLVWAKTNGLSITIESEARMENKMNKVYEGILVKVEDGEITGLHLDSDGLYSTDGQAASSPQRARDLMIRSFSDEISELEENGFDWDIIVREFKS
tara:strand:+ start:647 stop:1210 length:564 start_codon:yes stop_codon:yes gene_type:complete